MSLRDVVRAMILFKWFLEKLMKIKVLKEKILEEIRKRAEKGEKTYVCQILSVLFFLKFTTL